MSWLEDYLEYTHAQQAPTIFHFWVGLSIMAGSLQRRVWCEMRKNGVTYFRIFPGTFMTLLVSPPGIGHKTTAIDLGQDILEEIGVPIIEGKGSTEGILRELSRQSSTVLKAGPNGTITNQPSDTVATLIASELSVLISKAQYADSIVDLLLRLFDGGKQFQNITTGNPYKLTNPTVTFIGGATPEAIGSSLPPKAHGSGFTSRILPIYWDHLVADEANPIKPSEPLLDPHDEHVDHATILRMSTMRRHLIDTLRKMQDLSGKFSYSPEVREWLGEWLKEWTRTAQGNAEGYSSRRYSQLMRISMLVRISRHTEGELILNLEDVLGADAALREIEKKFHYALAFIGQSESERKRQKILDCILSHGGRASAMKIIRSTLRYYNSIEELRFTMKNLEEIGKIRKWGIDSMTKEEFWSIL